MSTTQLAALIPVSTAETESGLGPTMDRARLYAQNAKAAGTHKGYAADWQRFEVWCAAMGLPSLPAEPRTVALFIAQFAEGHKPATISRHMAAIAAGHKACGFESPASMRHGAVSSVWQGIKRTHGTAQVAKAPLLVENLRTIMGDLRPGLIGLRDRALILVGFAGAFRRAELAALAVNDVQFTSDGLVVSLRHSKTDQEGQGRKVGIPYGSNPSTCPVRALRAWLDAAGIESGPLLRAVNRHGRVATRAMSGFAIAGIVKLGAEKAGLSAADYSGHSLRAGLATSAAIAGVSERSIMNQTGHKNPSMVRRYIREGSLFRENAASRIGL